MRGLTVDVASANIPDAMRTLLPAPLWALAAATALAGCTSQPEAADTNAAMANTVASAKPAEMPPAIKADKTLRCKDNSLVYVTFFEGDKLAMVRTEQTGTPTRLTAAEAGQPLTAEGGWEMTGTPENVTIKTPDKASQACHA